MLEGSPENNAESREHWHSQEIFLPEHLNRDGYSGTYYFSVDPAGDAWKVTVVTKLKDGLPGGIDSKYTPKTFPTRAEAIAEAEQAATAGVEFEVVVKN